MTVVRAYSPFYNGVHACTVFSTNPFQSGIGSIDDLAVWSRALGPHEIPRIFTEGIREGTGLSLFYDFDEGTGAYARNKGQAGPQYDLVLGRSEVGGPTGYLVANKYGGTTPVPFTPPVWASTALPVATNDDRCIAAKLSAAVEPQPNGYGGKQFVALKESASVQFILEYFHPAGRKSNVRISRTPTHGRLEQEICAGGDCNRTTVVSVPFDISLDAYTSLVRCCVRVATLPLNH